MSIELKAALLREKIALRRGGKYQVTVSPFQWSGTQYFSVFLGSVNLEDPRPEQFLGDFYIDNKGSLGCSSTGKAVSFSPALQQKILVATRVHAEKAVMTINEDQFKQLMAA